MIRLIGDMVDRAGGIVNFVLCVILACIMAFAIIMLFSSIFMLWCKVR